MLPYTLLVMAGSAPRALRIEVKGKTATGIPEQLREAELARLLESAVLLPAPQIPAAAQRTDQAAQLENERGVVAAIIDEVAGTGAKVMVETNPRREAVTLDKAALATLGKATPDLDPALLPAFVDQQRKGGLPALPPNAKLVEDKLVSAIFEKGHWDGFHRRFPGTEGDLRLSPIAFGNGGNQAVLTAEWSSGPMNGIGALYVLQRDVAGTWAIMYRGILWLS